MRRLACSSGVRLVTSISARSTSPSEDWTLSRPRPRADASGDARQSAAATLVSAKRPGNFKFLFKASPGMTKRTRPRVRRNGAGSSTSRCYDADTPARPAHLEPTASPMIEAASKQRLVKDGNDHNISEIG